MANSLDIGWFDLARGVERLPLSNRLAWSDIRARYARSFIGPFWMALSTLVVTLAISFLITGLFGGSLQETIPFVMVGIVVYGYMQVSLNETSVALIGARGHLLGSPLPYSTFVFSSLLRNVLMMAHQFPAILVVIVGIGIMPRVEWLLAIPGLFIVVGTITGLGFFLAVVTSRFRDVGPVVALVGGIGALMSPVYWRPETLVKNQFIADLNPITYLLAVVRNPLIGQAITTEVWLWSSLSCVISLAMGFFTFAAFRKQLAFWI